MGRTCNRFHQHCPHAKDHGALGEHAGLQGGTSHLPVFAANQITMPTVSGMTRISLIQTPKA